jgi:hypothetical protein
LQRFPVGISQGRERNGIKQERRGRFNNSQKISYSLVTKICERRGGGESENGPFVSFKRLSFVWGDSTLRLGSELFRSSRQIMTCRDIRNNGSALSKS